MLGRGEGHAGSWVGEGTPGWQWVGSSGEVSVRRSACMHSLGTPSWDRGLLILAVHPTWGGGPHSPSSPVTAGCSPLPPWLAAVAVPLPPGAQPSVCSVSTDGHVPLGRSDPPPSPSPIPKQVVASHEHSREPSCTVQPLDGHPCSVPTGTRWPVSVSPLHSS